MVYLFASAAIVFLVDQLSKAMISAQAVVVGSARAGIIRISPVRTAPRHFSRRNFHATLAVVWIAALVSVALLRNTGGPFDTNLAMIALGAAFGGAAGNLSDMVRLGAVIDFIRIGWWPVFNIADAAIVAGLVVAFTGVRA